MRQRRKSGFTLIEVVVVLAVVALLIGLGAPLLFRTLQTAREEGTKDRLGSLKKAILGDPSLIQSGVRSDHGYLGDMGKMPGEGKSGAGEEEMLKELLFRASQPPFKHFSEFLIGAGWQGPYIGSRSGSNTEAALFDEYGRPYGYEIKAPQALAPDDILATISSKGADGVVSGDDVSAKIYKREAYGTVSGQIKRDKSGRPLSSVRVNLIYPDGRITPTDSAGILLKKGVLTGTDGRYQFDNVPFGIRSLLVEPGLVYAEGSAVSKGNGEEIEFKVTNFSPSPVSIVGVALNYDVSPTAYFSRLKIGDRLVFHDKGKDKIPRAASGQLIPVSPPIEVSGGGKLASPIVFHVDTPQTFIPDILISERLKVGGSIEVRIKHFRDTQAGAGKKIDLTGVPLSLLFDHGDGKQSVVFITPVRSPEPEDD